MMKSDEIEIVVYATSSGKEPFTSWISSIKDNKTQRVILSRIQRIRCGLLGDAKLLTNAKGISELRIDFGPGYRVYFAKIGKKLILLLCGGDKSSQSSDIKKAMMYLLDYQENND